MTRTWQQLLLILGIAGLGCESSWPGVPPTVTYEYPDLVFRVLIDGGKLDVHGYRITCDPNGAEIALYSSAQILRESQGEDLPDGMQNVLRISFSAADLTPSGLTVDLADDSWGALRLDVEKDGVVQTAMHSGPGATGTLVLTSVCQAVNNVEDVKALLYFAGVLLDAQARPVATRGYAELGVAASTLEATTIFFESP